MRLRRVPTALLLVIAAACAAPELPHDEGAVRADVAARAGGAPRVDLTDGLDEDEAVTLALWLEPEFWAALADLGFAKADLVRAGQLKNPVLSLLFPWGPKQFEATLNWPAEALWLRDARIDVARLDAEAVAARLVAHGLDVVRDVRAAYVEVEAAEAVLVARLNAARARAEAATLVDRARAAGDATEFATRSAAAESALAAARAAEAEAELERRRQELRRRIGLDANDPTPTLAERGPSTPSGGVPPGAENAVPDAALAEASRPELRAAELTLSAARARAAAAGGEAFAAALILDVNGDGKEGFEAGPGAAVALPLFDANDVGRADAAARLEAASRRFRAVRAAVRAEIVAAASAVDRLRVHAAAVDRALAAETAAERAAENAYRAGDATRLGVLEAASRRHDAEARAALAARDLRLARIAEDRAVGSRRDRREAPPSSSRGPSPTGVASRTAESRP